MSIIKKFSANVWREGEVFVADCPVLRIASQGITVKEALANLKEAIELYFEDESYDQSILLESFESQEIEVEIAS
ncbi:type II toxin-antitoxin system HicB family antitoxin [bacterium]|nr:type II toxin-antitoxin system HicB family antitoxin [FCB group bacterium]MBL7191816.1 type II toxin-antitoxin system HicB family antitoxin [bacterium]